MALGTKTQFILLAAGRSTRMKQDKALLQYSERSWIQWQVEQILDSGVIETVIVVEPPEKKELYAHLLQNFPVRFVENLNPLSQPADSIMLAIQNGSFPSGTFISPIDVPIQKELLKILWRKSQEGFLCVKPSYQKKGGHPVWIHSILTDKFKAKPQRLDEFLSQLSPTEIHFEEISDPQVQMNLNTPEDWQNFLNQQKENLKN